MATLVAIGYPDQGTSEQARETVSRLEADLVSQTDQRSGGTIIKTSLSDEDTEKLQAALQPPATVGVGS